MRKSALKRRPTSHRLLAGTFAGVLVLLVSACSSDEDDPPIPHHSFITRSDLAPPQVVISHGEAWAPEYEEADEYIFLTPNYGTETPSSGAMILDSNGELVWMDPDESEEDEDKYFDLRVQQYRGEPMLTVWQGNSSGGRGNGDILVLNDAYEEIARVTTGGSLEAGEADFHDTVITDQDTMLIAAYEPTPFDLTAVGGPEDGYAEDAVIQEVDIATGEVLLEWSALEHVDLTDTMVDFDDEQDELDDEDEGAELGTEEEPFDFFHINSMTEDHDGSILVSARHTHAVYRLDRTTGDVEWTLGGESSDFELDADAIFTWQHDAERAPDGTLTLLDNHANGSLSDETSRGLRLALDEESMTASVDTEYNPPDDRSAGSMANAQQLSNGNMLIGWGSEPNYSEFTPDGQLIYDVCHGDVCHDGDFRGGGGSYRAYKAQWQGNPETTPDVAIEQNNDDEEPVVHVSWNGATEIAQWRLLAGEDEADATAHTTVDRESFETAIPAPADAQYIAVEALSDDGEVLATGTAEE